MLSLIVAHLIVLSTAVTPIAKTVCAYNHCVGTKTNPLPYQQIWASQGIIAESGCCAWWKGPCERCVQPYTCYQYKDGEDNAWCQDQQNATNGDIVFTNGNNNNYVGCGWCGCCVKTDLQTGLPKNNFGTASGWVDSTTNEMNDLKNGKLTSDSSDPDSDPAAPQVPQPASPQSTLAGPSDAKLHSLDMVYHMEEENTDLVMEKEETWSRKELQEHDAEAQFVVQTESFHVFDYGVYGFAAVGFAVIVYGAYMHYSGKTEEQNMSML